MVFMNSIDTIFDGEILNEWRNLVVGKAENAGAAVERAMDEIWEMIEIICYSVGDGLAYPHEGVDG